MKTIEDLKKEIELKFGRQLVTPSGFDELYLRIKSVTGKEISVSTLKRIWGYVKYEHQPRYEILSILARFLGYHDWNEFQASKELESASDFLNTDIIESKNLRKGEIVKVTWAPDRECEFVYLDNSIFKVMKARNSKISLGDTFSCNLMSLGQPLMCASVKRDGNLIAECYIAGRKGGISSLKLKNQ